MANQPPPTAAEDPPPRFSTGQLTVLVAYLVALAAGAVATLIVFWTMRVSDLVGDEVRMLVLVFAAGVAGSVVFAISSLGRYVGARNDEASYFVFYILRPFEGGLLAIVFYYLMRGGLVVLFVGDSNLQDPTNLNEFALLGVAGLVGIFARFVVQWLRDRLSQLLHQNEASSGGDPPARPAPAPAEGEPSGNPPASGERSEPTEGGIARTR